MSEGTRGTRFIGLDIANFYRIEAAELEFSGEGGVIEITGNNMQGKTSVLQSVKGLVGGASEVDEDPRNDEHEGEPSRLVGRLSNMFQIRRRPTDGNPKGNLVIVGPDGEKASDDGEKYGQRFLDQWISRSAFDLHAPKEFASKPEKLTPILLAIAPDPDLPEKWKALKRRVQELENDRSPHVSDKQKAERTKRPEGERPEKIEVSAEATRLSELQADADARANLRSEISKAEGSVKNLDERIGKGEELVARLRRELEEAENLLSELGGEREAKLEEIAVFESDLAKILDPEAEIAVVNEKLRAADARSEELEPWHEWDRAQDEIERCRDEIEGYNKKIEAVRREERDLLANAGLNIPGLSFDENGIPLLWDRGLEKASGRQWVEFSAAMAFQTDPELRVALIDEAEGIDLEGMKRIHELAKREDFQVFMCRISATGVGEVVVCEDGRAWMKERDVA